MHNDTWQLQEAKARLSEVLRAVKERKTPQVITVHGKKEVMVVPYRKTRAKSPVGPKKPKTVLDAMKAFGDIKLTRKELEMLFGRDRSAKARGTDESLFD
jgi:prevent-host-death family protein